MSDTEKSDADFDPERQIMEEKMNDGRKMMRSQNQILRDGIRTMKETSEIANVTESKLDDQGKQIKGLDKKFDEIDHNLARSKRILKNMSLSMFNPFKYFGKQ